MICEASDKKKELWGIAKFAVILFRDPTANTKHLPVICQPQIYETSHQIFVGSREADKAEASAIKDIGWQAQKDSIYCRQR